MIISGLRISCATTVDSRPERRQPLALRLLALERADRLGQRVEGAAQQPRVLVGPDALRHRDAVRQVAGGRHLAHGRGDGRQRTRDRARDEVAEHRRQQQRGDQRAGETRADRVQEARAVGPRSAGSAWWARRRPRRRPRPRPCSGRATITKRSPPSSTSVTSVAFDRAAPAAPGPRAAARPTAPGRWPQTRSRCRSPLSTGPPGGRRGRTPRSAGPGGPAGSPPSTMGTLTTCSRPRGWGSSVSTSAKASARSATAGRLVAS